MCIKFKSNSRLRGHKLVHSIDRPYTCIPMHSVERNSKPVVILVAISVLTWMKCTYPECGKKFTSNGYLETHKRFLKDHTLAPIKNAVRNLQRVVILENMNSQEGDTVRVYFSTVERNLNRTND